MNAVLRSDLVAPTPAEEPRHTMKLIAEALSPSTPPIGPFVAANAPAWPLLDALAEPPAAAEAPEPARGTLVQLFGGLAAAPSFTAVPMGLPPAAFAPPAANQPPIAAATPLAAPVAYPLAASAASPLAAPAAGPFPPAWAPQSPSMAAPDGSPGLVPADHVTTPLAEVLQQLGRGGAVANPAFAGLRLPGGGPR